VWSMLHGVRCHGMCSTITTVLACPAPVLQVQPLDPVEVLAMEGQPVPAGVPVLLVHCATLAPLAIDAGRSARGSVSKVKGLLP
jgi:hypothetical protein